MKRIMEAMLELVVVVAIVGIVITLLVPMGYFRPSRTVDKIENLSFPVAVLGWDKTGLILADGKHIQLPDFSKLPTNSKGLSEATREGVEIADDGRIYGLVRVNHNCHLDRVRKHVAKVDLSHMLTFFREGIRTTPPADPNLLADSPGGWFSKRGMGVYSFYLFNMYRLRSEYKESHKSLKDRPEDTTAMLTHAQTIVKYHELIGFGDLQLAIQLLQNVEKKMPKAKHQEIQELLQYAQSEKMRKDAP